jgi:ABC-type sugar transport system substrate-binding protein
LKDLQQKAGLVLLNVWTPEIEEYAKSWSKALPFGTISTHHTKVGEIQGQQASARLPARGHVLCVTGPSRSSAAVERMEGFKRTLRKDATFDETAGGSWTEADGISAFNSWYGIRKTRAIKVDVIAAQNDELGLGARSAIEAIGNSEHRKVLSAAAILGVDACPGYGRKAVDQGRLTASVTTPANTGEAIRALNKFWATGIPVRLKALTPPSPYPS